MFNIFTPRAYTWSDTEIYKSSLQSIVQRIIGLKVFPAGFNIYGYYLDLIFKQMSNISLF